MRFHGLYQFCAWIDQTALSQAIQASGWVVATMQTFHILAISAVFASGTMIGLRMAGLIGRDVPARRYAARFLPFIWWPLVVLLATGIVLIIGEPARELANIMFQLKMLMLIGAIVATRFLQLRLSQPPGSTSGTISGGVSGASDLVVAPTDQRLGLLALALWVGIIFAGRWIAYM